MDRRAYLHRTFSCTCGETHHVPVRRIDIGAGLLPRLPALLHDVGCHGRGVLVADETTWEVAGQRIEALHITALHTHVIPSAHPHADRVTADMVTAAVANAQYLISCGSGTVTDLVKYAAHRHQIPFVAVATAPSMNGYMSGIVALTDKGLKTTVPVTPAVALLADTDIVCHAPLPMLQAGLGDLVSKPVCNADWRLASLVRGEPFCALPFQMIADLEAIYLPQAGAIPSRSPAVIAALIEAIAYSGISMVMAGSSAPASGGEHLISHVLDMDAERAHQPLRDFHGTQVGVATLLTARLYDAFLTTPRDRIDWGHARHNWQPLEAHASALRARWGRAGDSVVAAFARKHPTSHVAHAAEIALLESQWETLQAAVTPFVVNTPAIAVALAAAGAKTRYEALGLTREAFTRTILDARFIRDRYTILDLLDTVGLLNSTVAAVLQGRG